MNRTSKSFVAFIILIIAISSLSLLMIKPANAQTILKPSVPEFTVKYVDRSYYVPPVYGIDQYSGKNVQTGGGFTVTNKTLEITIVSQSFTPYVFNDGTPHSVYLRWDTAFKGHFGEDWRISNQSPNWNESSKVISFGLGTDIPAGSGDQIDFKVRARIGYDTFIRPPSISDLYNEGGLEFHGETSDWSNTQTITIPGTSTSASPTPISTLPNYGPTSSPTPNPTTAVPEFSWLTILPFFVSLFLVAVCFKHRRTNHE
jgi:hypothetical protein